VISILFWLSVGVIGYAYFGYPLAVWLLARLFPRPVRGAEGETPHVTLLIAAYNEQDVIEEKIRNSLALDYPPEQLHLLIVTDGSSDLTPKLVESYADRGVQLLHKPERAGKMAAINRALPLARGEVIVFSDANNFYRPETLRRLVAPLADPAVGAVSGAKMIEQDEGSLGASEGLYWKYESFIKKQESRLGSCTSATGEILAIRKGLYCQPPDNIINDDFYIAMQVVRQGYRFVYAPQAVSFERVSQTARDEVIRRTRINAGRYQAIAMARQVVPFNNPLVAWQIYSHKFLRPLVPLFMIAALLLNLLAVLLPSPARGFWGLGMPYSAILLGLQLAFYALAALGSVAGGKKKGKQNKLVRLLYLPTFLTNSNLAALQGLVKYLRGGQFHIWERIQRG
jgi:cellulose synthase/poly-beta-1,6-N-acetylglucosamine synthase-like glycosyltransferase